MDVASGRLASTNIGTDGRRVATSELLARWPHANRQLEALTDQIDVSWGNIQVEPNRRVLSARAREQWHQVFFRKLAG